MKNRTNGKKKLFSSRRSAIILALSAMEIWNSKSQNVILWALEKMWRHLRTKVGESNFFTAQNAGFRQFFTYASMVLYDNLS